MFLVGVLWDFDYVKMYREGEKLEYVNFFSADYRDGRVYIGGKNYPAGTFAMNLLNQYYENDTAARIAVFKMYNLAVLRKLEQGYINPSNFVKCREEISNILKTLPILKPFSMLDTDKERNRITELFTENNAYFILDYLRQKAAAVQRDNDELALDLIPNNYDKDLFQRAAELLNDVVATLTFYDNLSADMRKAFESLTKFVSRIDEAERFDEPHLLPIAIEIFGQEPFPIKTEYVAIPKTSRSKELVTARRLYFESYYSFIITDFFEGLHNGHYPRQCGICKKHFLMQSATRQKYCTGYAPFKVKGKAITCRKYAARINRREYAENNPLVRIYKNRCSAIRMEKKRGTITKEFANTALIVAQNNFGRAKNDPEYANGQYETDMSREKLYKDTDNEMK